MSLIFFNIGWMNRYEGLNAKPDKIVGGGSYVSAEGVGHEVCNFLECSNGKTYGHVETIKGAVDRKINLSRLHKGAGEYIDGVTVVWTATHPNEGGRRVVGWYKNARVYSARQRYKKSLSQQHSKDKLFSYMTVAASEDTWLLPLEKRTLRLKQGKTGWFGQTPWWIPGENSPPDVKLFLKSVDKLINFTDESEEITSLPRHQTSFGAAASTPYTRYVRSFEIQVTPAHYNLQKQFVDYLNKEGARIQEDLDNIDVQFKLPGTKNVLGEVKPCDMSNCRYAIRTAMGQLLDYRQRSMGTNRLLIIVSVQPTAENVELATSNGFGIAYPQSNSFEIIWP